MPRIFQHTQRTTTSVFDLRPVLPFTAGLTLGPEHGTVVADTTSGNITLTLPAAVSAEGRMYVITKKVAANILLVQTTGSDTIGYVGYTVIKMSAQDETVTLLSLGAEGVWQACSCGAVTQGTVSGVWHTRLTSAASGFTVGTSAQYAMIGTASSPATGKGTIGDAQFRAPVALTVTGMYVRLATALSSTETLDANININGTADTTFTVSHDSGSGTLASAAGDIAIAQDDLVCVEFTFGGGLSSASINSITIPYEHVIS